MHVVYQMEITHHVQTVPVYQMVIHMKMNAVYVMMIALMTAYRIVWVNGVVVQLKKHFGLI